MSIENDLKALITSEYKSIRDFSLSVNMPYSTLDSIFKRGIENASVTNIIKICKSLHISADALASGHIVHAQSTQSHALAPFAHRIGCAYSIAPKPIQKTVEVALEPYLEEVKASFNEETAADLSPTLTLIKEPVLRPVPEYTLPAAAGTGEFLDSDDFDMVDVDDRVPLSANFGVRIRGDSMEPKYPDGHIAWVRRSSSVDAGAVGVFMLDGQGYIKKMGRGELISLNPKYDPIPLPEDGEDFRISGVVVGVTEDDYR